MLPLWWEWKDHWTYPDSLFKSEGFVVFSHFSLRHCLASPLYSNRDFDWLAGFLIREKHKKIWMEHFLASFGQSEEKEIGIAMAKLQLICSSVHWGVLYTGWGRRRVLVPLLQVVTQNPERYDWVGFDWANQNAAGAPRNLLPQSWRFLLDGAIRASSQSCSKWVWLEPPPVGPCEALGPGLFGKSLGSLGPLVSRHGAFDYLPSMCAPEGTCPFQGPSFGDETPILQTDEDPLRLISFGLGLLWLQILRLQI